MPIIAIAIPAINAILNATSGVLIVLGYIFVRRRQFNAHRACMVAALGTSTLFLISYLIYHYQHGSTKFTGQGWVRPLYFFILLTHTVLATAIVPLVIKTVYHAGQEQFARHMKIARWTFPIWLYVSITGVIVYLMLYQIYPAR
jgi:putative membrane protein